jgi:hypothetical protein
LGARLLSRALEGEVGKCGGRRVRGEEAVEVLSGRAVDSGYDEVARKGKILAFMSAASCAERRIN